MSYPVTYYCPRCEALVELEREGYLADKAVTPYPLEGWTYVAPGEDYEADDADGVRLVCGEEGLLADEETEGCGEAFYLSFVRFANGEEIDPRAEPESVELGLGPNVGGPSGPSGPDGSGGFWP